MNPEHLPAGIALMIDDQGIIQQVVQDGVGIPGLQAGMPLGQCIDSGSRTKWFSFLAEMRASGAAYDWEINLRQGEKVVTLRLEGMSRGPRLMILGARTPQDALDLCDELTKISCEQATALRAAIQKQIEAGRASPDENVTLFDEISRLNNELVSLQRDLVKKNAELERLNAEIQKLAITDALTGVYNRRGFFEVGSRELERARRFQHPLTAVMFDLDHFKAVNDTSGHAAGDAVLREVAARCASRIRKADLFGRLGGDEFALLLVETGGDGAAIIAERLRCAVEDPIQFEGKTLRVTLSLGAAIMSPDSADLDALLARADQALYQAKDAGRNCIAFDLS